MQQRRPLALKPTNSNIQRSRSSSPLKRSDSPTKVTLYSTSPTKRARLSPTKKLQNSSATSEFVIFQDDSPSPTKSSSLTPTSSLIPVFNDISISNSNTNNKENNLSIQESKQLLEEQNKENPSHPDTNISHTTVSIRQSRSSSHTRIPLSDLNIHAFPGYFHNGPLKPLQPLQQLNEPWYTNQFSKKQQRSIHKRLLVPSYVTPPKRNRVHCYKYISNMNTSRKNLSSKLESIDDSLYRSQTESHNSKPFYIYNDNLDSQQ